MKLSIATAVLALCALGVVHAQGPAPSGMKAGLWESRSVKMVMDGKDMLPQMVAAQTQMREQMAKMPPEQRKKMEAVLGSNQGDPLTQRMCVSPEMAQQQQAMVPRPARADCAEPKLTRDGNRTAFEFSCKQAKGTITGKGETVASADQVKVTVDTVNTDAAGAKHTMQVETHMKFLGADCGGLKPLDQMAKQAQAQAASRAGPRPAAPQK